MRIPMRIRIQIFLFDADTDPTFYLDADPDPTFHPDADSDPYPGQIQIQIQIIASKKSSNP
jgi:hypothetical protein